jgi:uncharacterized membrane protein YheB (UPF0754 family)
MREALRARQILALKLKEETRLEHEEINKQVKKKLQKERVKQHIEKKVNKQLNKKVEDEVHKRLKNMVSESEPEIESESESENDSEEVIIQPIRKSKPKTKAPPQKKQVEEVIKTNPNLVRFF